MSKPSVSSRPSRTPRKSCKAILLEGLENRLLMSVGELQHHQAVRIETSLGRITVELTPDVTPLTVANFLRYVDAGRYDNTIFHRSNNLSSNPAAPNAIIQGGGFKVAGNSYQDVKTEDFVNQFGMLQNEFDLLKPVGSTNKVNVRGTIAMAKTSDPNSATSQFFFNVRDNSQALDDRSNSGGFTTFGNIIGSGLHVADAIANLQHVNATSSNPAFGELPVLPSAFSTNPVVVSSAKAQDILPVTLDNKTKFVTWQDESGGTATITLSKGTADLKFVGGNDMRYVVHGNRVTITGKNVDLEEVATHGTTKASVLAVKSVGGHGPAHLGNITVSGRKALGRIDAPTVQLRGDITADQATIGSINLQGTYRSTIHTDGGKLSLHIGTAVDTSVNTSGSNSDARAKGTIKSLVAQTWVDDGQLDTSIVTGRLNSMEVNGDFSSDITTSGDVGLLKINGNVGSKGTSKWTIGGNAKNIQTGKMIGLTLTTVKRLENLHAREVVATDDGTATKITARSIGHVTLATLTNQSLISSAAGINSVTVTGLMDSSTIRAGKNIGSVVVGTLSGNTVNSTQTALVPSAIFAGVVSTFPADYVTLPGSFVPKSGATIGLVKVRQKFSNTDIAAPNLGSLDLGNVQAANLNAFGVTADKRIGTLLATVKNKHVAMPAAKSDAEVKAYFKKIGLELFPRNKQGNGNRFNVSIV